MTKENKHGTQHPTNTEWKTDVTRVGWCARRARKNKQERFTALLHHVNVELLRDSYYGLKRKAAPGVDGLTWKEYETGLEDRLQDLHGRVHRGAYRALPSKRSYVPKANAKLRPLGIAALDALYVGIRGKKVNWILDLDLKGFLGPGMSSSTSLSPAFQAGYCIEGFVSALLELRLLALFNVGLGSTSNP